MANLVYRFRFPDGRTESLQVEPAATGADDAELPQWTELGVHQCPNCPLSPSTSPRCPMAVRFVPLIELFGRLRSYEEVVAEVETDERTVTKQTTVQRALRSLMGVLSASSGCPRVDFLKPMAHFHLPFSSEEETVYRVASSYLLAQYFLRQRGEAADPGIEGLKAHYQELQQVNAHMAQRMRTIQIQDATLNALVLLDMFAQAVPFSIDAALEDLQPAFEKFLG